MIRGLTMIAIGGAVASALCFGVASSRGPTSFSLVDLEWGDHTPSGPQLTRTIPWDGAHEITINLPAQIIIKQGPKAEITLQGSEKLVQRVVLKDNTLDTDDDTPHHHSHFHNARLVLTITAPELNIITMNGFGSLDIQDYDQKTLDLIINGAASVKGHGRAENVKVEIDGAASVKLTDMDITNLDLSMNGAGSAKAGPTGHAKISIDGAGSVKLTKAPASLTKQIDGVGSVSVPDGTPESHEHSPSGKQDKSTDKQDESEDLSF